MTRQDPGILPDCPVFGCGMPAITEGTRCVRHTYGLSWCPAACGAERRPQQLLCPSCWSRLPEPIQRQVVTAWRRWRLDTRDAVRVREYREISGYAVRRVYCEPRPAEEHTDLSAGLPRVEQ